MILLVKNIFWRRLFDIFRKMHWWSIASSIFSNWFISRYQEQFHNLVHTIVRLLTTHREIHSSSPVPQKNTHSHCELFVLIALPQTIETIDLLLPCICIDCLDLNYSTCIWIKNVVGGTLVFKQGQVKDDVWRVISRYLYLLITNHLFPRLSLHCITSGYDISKLKVWGGIISGIYNLLLHFAIAVLCG